MPARISQAVSNMRVLITNQVTQSYPLKLPQQAELQVHIDNLKKITMLAGQQLLEQLWSEEWLEAVKNSTTKAYKAIGAIRWN